MRRASPPGLGLALWLAVSLLACDGPTNPDFGPPDLGPPPAALHLLSVDPPDGATGVSEGSRVQLRFSRALDPATLTLAALRVVDEEQEQALDGYLSTGGDGSLAIFQPSAALRSPAVPYRIELAPTLRAQDGGRLELDEASPPLPSHFVTLVPPDTEAPVFASLERSAAALGPQTVRLRWEAARDPGDRTPQSELTYLVYAAPADQALELDQAALVVEHGVCEATLGGLQPDTLYTFVVHARDLAGNEDDNDARVQARTLAEAVTQHLTVLYGADVSGKLEPCG